MHLMYSFLRSSIHLNIIKFFQNKAVKNFTVMHSCTCLPVCCTPSGTDQQQLAFAGEKVQLQLQSQYARMFIFSVHFLISLFSFYACCRVLNDMQLMVRPFLCSFSEICFTFYLTALSSDMCNMALLTFYEHTYKLCAENMHIKIYAFGDYLKHKV